MYYNDNFTDALALHLPYFVLPLLTVSLYLTLLMCVVSVVY